MPDRQRGGGGRGSEPSKVRKGKLMKADADRRDIEFDLNEISGRSANNAKCNADGYRLQPL
jgi:hypothetical protein